MIARNKKDKKIEKNFRCSREISDGLDLQIKNKTEISNHFVAGKIHPRSFVETKRWQLQNHPPGDSRILFLGFLGEAMHVVHQKLSKGDKKLVPLLQFTESGHPRRLERFSHYVARQMGFGEPDDCNRLCKLADDYLKKSGGCEENIFDFFSSDENAKSLYSNLIEEFDKCILGYFAFHWSHASLMIYQALNGESGQKRKLKNLIMAATRKQRFERVIKDLKVKRLFSTLVEEMKAIGRNSPRCEDVVAPAALQEDRSPVLLLMGGGMGAGKSTVLKQILKEPFWLTAAEQAVVVEADAFKESDVIYKALNAKCHHDMLQTAELVHQSSIDAASSLLVTALNEGRDVIMDGTLSWVPFVEQTISMARNIHLRRYRMGVGYKVSDDGSVIENYWEEAEEEDEEMAAWKNRKPYKIELVGVVCDAYLAVVRGMRRAILTGRAVRVKSQLNSHKRFAAAFPRYSQLVDHATLYCTNDMGNPPKLIGECKMLVDPDQIDCLKRLRMLDEDAECVYDLYPYTCHTDGSSYAWRHVLESQLRGIHQQELKIAITKIENHKSNKCAKRVQ